jgi:hypothetical protein
MWPPRLHMTLETFFVAPPPGTAAEEATVGASFTDTALKLAISEHYTLLRGAIAQLAGALLVYRNSARFEPDAIVALATQAQRRANETLAALRAGTAPPLLVSCRAAAEHLRLAARLVLESLRAGGGLQSAERAFAPLKEAYRVLAGAASNRDGCTMIAFDGCCCCPPKPLMRT